MLITTTDSVPGHNVVAVIGYVSGNSVKARNIGSDMLAGLKSLVGGEIHQYAKLMNDTRQVAIDRMIEQATKSGANAIVGMRLVTSEIMQNCSELCAYGTAVVID